MDKLPGTAKLSFRIKNMSCSSPMKLLWVYIIYWCQLGTFLEVYKYTFQGKMLIVRNSKLLNSFL